jgi:hypothetical protein
MNNTRTFRMKLKTYKNIRRIFPCVRGETTASYFERLSEAMRYGKI